MKSYCLRVFTLRVFTLTSSIAFVLLASLSVLSMYASVPVNTLPYYSHDIVGRENEISELKSLLQHYSGAPKIVSITGGPGFGKSTLAIAVGHELETEGVSMIYVDLNDEITTKYEIATKIVVRVDKEAESQSTHKDSMEKLMDWSERLSSKTLLILDNCDEHFHVEKDALQSLIVRLLKQSKHLKILTTSRRQVTYVEAHKLFPINELSDSHACELLRSTVESLRLDDDQCEDIAYLTGRVPLALHVVGAILDMPNAPSLQQIVKDLNQSLISTLSPEELQTKDTVNASIFVSYQYLDFALRKAGRYLSFFPGSFSETAACEIVENDSASACKITGLLVRRSLLKCESLFGTCKYHRLIKEFFKSMSNAAELSVFNFRFMKYYGSQIEKYLNNDMLHLDEHNYNHLDHLLGSEGSIANIGEEEATVILKAAESIYRYHSLVILPQYELVNKAPVYRNILSHFNNITRNLTQFLDKTRFFDVYSKLVMQLIKIEKSPFANTKLPDQIKSMRQYRWAFLKYGQFVPTNEYLDYFSTLASYYMEAKNYSKAKSCHVLILRRQKLLEKCDGECDNIKLAIAFAKQRDEAKSSLYSDWELDSLLQISPSQDVAIVMKISKTLCQLYTIYSASNTLHNMKQVTDKMAEMTESIIHDPPLVVEHIETILTAIKILQSVNANIESHRLKNYLKQGLHKIEYFNYNIMINVIYRIHEQYEYELLIILGEILDDDIVVMELSHYGRVLRYVGNAHYKLKNYTASKFYYEKLIGLNGYSTSGDLESAYFRLIRMGSFTYLPQTLVFAWDILQGNFGFLNSCIELLQESPSQPQYEHYVENDYLSNDVTATYTSDLNTPRELSSTTINAEKTLEYNFGRKSVIMIDIIACSLVIAMTFGIPLSLPCAIYFFCIFIYSNRQFAHGHTGFIMFLFVLLASLLIMLQYYVALLLLCIIILCFCNKQFTYLVKAIFSVVVFLLFIYIYVYIYAEYSDG